MSPLNPIAEFTVKLDQQERGEIKKGNLDKGLDPSKNPGLSAVKEFVDALPGRPRQTLLDALTLCVDASSPGASLYNWEVTFSAEKVGYELQGIQVSVTDESWEDPASPDDKKKRKPLKVKFSYSKP